MKATTVVLLALASLTEASALPKRADGATAKADGHNYYNDKTRKFWVNGTAGAIPLVDFEVGESYAGLMPLSDKPDETRQLYFWFWPTAGGKDTEEDLVIWFNGGPGCSSLTGFLQENGPISYQNGMPKPVKNPYSWNKLANVIYVEQPIGTGFTQGKPDIHNDEENAQEFLGFWKQFLDTFTDLKGKRVWISGESYGGYHVPYITNAFFKANDTTYYNARGLLMNDPWIDDGQYFQSFVGQYPYVKQWKDLLGFEDATIEKLGAAFRKCGFQDLVDQAYTFPPKAPIMPTVEIGWEHGFPAGECDIGSPIYNTVTIKNPCFNPYRASDMCPTPPDVLQPYFNRRDVQDAIHAPHMNWTQCPKEGESVFVGPTGYTTSHGSNLIQLPECIEKSDRAVIANGELDFLNTGYGVFMAIQNMTWAGKQGFQKKPYKRFVVDHDEQGDMGEWTEERGLTYVTVNLAGHFLPGHQPGASFQLLEYLLGKIDTLSGKNSTLSMDVDLK